MGSSSTSAPVYFDLGAFTSGSSAGQFYTSYYTTNFTDADKAFLSLQLLTDGLDSTNTIAVSYQVSELALTGSWTTLATFNSDNDTKFFSSTTTGKKIRFKLDFTSDSTSASPTLLGIILTGTDGIIADQFWDLLILAEDNALGGNRSTAKQSGKTIRDQLTTWRNTTWPLTFYDRDETSYSVKIVELDEPNLNSVPHPGGTGQKFKSGIHLKLQRVRTA